jgi:chromosome segregation ATPase
MVEPAMYFAIGFLFASLIGIVFIPLVHNRAVRLTIRRLEASTPLSMAEIQADKDQLRAEFAMSTRRLEMSVEQMKAKTTSQLAEIGKKSEAINRLKMELGEKTATIFSLEAREKALKDQLRATEEEYSVKTSSLRDAERALSDKSAELEKFNAELNSKTAVTDSQRVEIVSLKTQIEALKDRIEDYEREVKDTGDRLDRERREVTTASKELTDERGRVENLGKRAARLEQQIAEQQVIGEALERRIQELQTRIGEQGQKLAEREYESDQLRSELEKLRQTESYLRADLSASQDGHYEATKGLRSEKLLLEKQLEQAIEERNKLQSEIAAIKRDADSSWASERVENALLRERINDVAAEVARLTVVLEGPSSPIESLLASPPQAPVNGVDRTDTSAGEESKGNLAERMRALQARASRLPSAT